MSEECNPISVVSLDRKTLLAAWQQVERSTLELTQALEGSPLPDAHKVAALLSKGAQVDRAAQKERGDFDFGDHWTKLLITEDRLDLLDLLLGGAINPAAFVRLVSQSLVKSEKALDILAILDKHGALIDETRTPLLFSAIDENHVPAASWMVMRSPGMLSNSGAAAERTKTPQVKSLAMLDLVLKAGYSFSLENVLDFCIHAPQPKLDLLLRMEPELGGYDETALKKIWQGLFTGKSHALNQERLDGIVEIGRHVMGRRPCLASELTNIDMVGMTGLLKLGFTSEDALSALDPKIMSSKTLLDSFQMFPAHAKENFNEYLFMCRLLDECQELGVSLETLNKLSPVSNRWALPFWLCGWEKGDADIYLGYLPSDLADKLLSFRQKDVLESKTTQNNEMNKARRI